MDGLPIPKQCHSCASSNIVFREKRNNPGRWLWACKDCSACVAGDPKTKRPFGYMAGERIHAFRYAVNQAIEAINADKLQGFGKTFQWLGFSLGLEGPAVIGMLSDSQLLRSIELLHERHAQLLKLKARRAVKRKAKFIESMAKETQFVERRKRMNKPRRN